jgi:signal transduction histidine kinase/ligand-binding sensor domain-containing protein/DNA-binding response OmpR family regulator
MTMIGRKQLITLAAYLLFFNTPIHAINQSVSHLTIKDGLSQSTIKCILQDSYGFMWFGSADGLNKYDAYRFTVYRNIPTNPSSLCGNDISCLFEDPEDSTLWIGTQGDGLNLYNRKTDSFIRFKTQNHVANSLPSNDIRAIVKGPDKNLWIATYGSGVCCYTINDSSFIALQFSSLPHLTHINALAFDTKGGLWIGSNNGLYYLESAAGINFNKKAPQKITITNLQSTNITTLLFDRKGNLWMGTLNQGLFRYHPDTKNLSHYTSNFLSDNALTSNTIHCITQRSDNSVWIGTNEGLYRFNPHTDDFKAFKNDPTDTESLNDDVIFSLYEDKSGILWMGTYFGGINKMDPDESRFIKFSNFHKLFNLSKASNNIKSIYKDESNTVWLTTLKGLIALHENYFNQPSKSNNASIYFKDTDQHLIFGDSYQNIYLSNEKGLFIRKKGSQVFQSFTPKNQKGQVPLDHISFGFEDSDRMVWLFSPSGIFKHSPLTEQTEQIKPIIENGTLPNEYFISGTESNDGQLWLGTVAGDLFQYNRYTNRIKQINPNNLSHNTPYNRIFSIHEDVPGSIWYGTNNGLYNYKEKENTVKSYLSSEGLANNVVYSVLPDKKKRIWCTTNLGISVFNPDNQTFTNYTWEDGLQSNEYNQSAYFQSKTGTIYVGGIDGFNIIEPERIIPNEFVPPVVITGLSVYHELITPLSHPQITPNHISETKEIILTHKQAIFTFEFSALNFIHSNKNQYRYKLDGYDTDWVNAGTNRTASYTNIHHGTYTFMVQGTNNNGIWNQTPTTLTITILPPFWLTWWFKSLGIIFFIIILYLTFSFRLRSIKRKASILKKMVNEKTTALSEKNKQIEQQNEELIRINLEMNSRNEKIEQKNKQLNEQNEQIAHQRDNLIQLSEQLQEVNQAKINFFTSISHEFRTPLTLMISPLKELITNTNEISPAELQRKFKIIYGNASKLLTLVNQLLDFRKAETNNINLHLTKQDLVGFTKQTALLFNDIAKRKNISFKFVTSLTSLEVCFDEEKLEKIFYNLLSNAFKFTPEQGEITLSLELTQTEPTEFIKLALNDTGQGIPEKDLHLIFEPFQQSSITKKQNQTGSGIGLALVKKYVELHNGQITVSSSAGVGSTFTINIPVVSSCDETKTLKPDFTHQLTNPTDLLVASLSESSPLMLKEVKTGEEHHLPKLLLVEDDNDLRAYLKEVLLANYRVFEASIAAGGFELASLKHPDLIISDVMLPDYNGFVLCEKIKNEFKTSHIPVILLTALADMTNQLSGLKSGADAYISKPFDLQHLFLTIENLIRQRRKMQAKFYQGINLDTTEYTPNKEDQNFLARVIAEIEKNITDSSFDVETLCKCINLSQPQTYRKIKALTNLSITEFIRNIRIKKAAQMLASGTHTISEVAYEVGFSDPNYFSKCFTKVYGQTPSEFVKLKK